MMDGAIRAVKEFRVIFLTGSLMKRRCITFPPVMHAFSFSPIIQDPGGDVDEI